MESKEKALLLLSVALISAALTFVIYSFYYMGESYAIKTDLLVGYKIGPNLDNDTMHFGMLPPGTKGVRKISVASSKNGKILFYAKGNISRFLSFAPNPLIVERGGEYIVEVKATIPKHEKTGAYEGVVIGSFRR